MNIVHIKKNHWGQYVIFVQASIAMLWSLYYQYYGDPVANIINGAVFHGAGWFAPCTLCRWARILMYPLVLLALISLIRKDRSIVHYIFPISILGIILETYQYLLQKTSWMNFISWSGFCTIDVPCKIFKVDYFGFITIPFLCLVAFIVIFIACLAVKKSLKKHSPLHHTHI